MAGRTLCQETLTDIYIHMGGEGILIDIHVFKLSSLAMRNDIAAKTKLFWNPASALRMEKGLIKNLPRVGRRLELDTTDTAATLIRHFHAAQSKINTLQILIQAATSHLLHKRQWYL